MMPLSEPESDNIVEMGRRQVPATFGKREVRHDPAWERDLANYLKGTNSPAELLDLFARF